MSELKEVLSGGSEDLSPEEYLKEREQEIEEYTHHINISLDDGNSVHIDPGHIEIYEGRVFVFSETLPSMTFEMSNVNSINMFKNE